MKGRIYISGVFANLKYVKCRPNVDWLDNDPHFWSSPPTWGICRTDFRGVMSKGDYIFFVLPKKTDLPQMVYGYFKIADHIDHLTAYHLFPNKRMRETNPNGNIIVNADGTYNQLDGGAHLSRFNQIKKHYIVGEIRDHCFLKPVHIRRLAPLFLNTLNNIFNCDKNEIIKILTRKGRILNESQIYMLMNWLKN